MSGRVLVTGGTGFVGKNLVSALWHKGYDVHVVMRPTSIYSPCGDEKPTFHVHEGSTRDLVAAMLEIRPDTVLHVAAQVLSSHEPADVDSLVCANVLFGTQVAEAAVAAGVQKFINTGTYWQHYQGEVYNPVCLYAATKKAFEDILAYYQAVSSLRCVTLELYDTYGPLDARRKLFRLLYEADRLREPLYMTPGGQLMDLVYIDDVVNAYLHAMVSLDDPNFPCGSYSVSAENSLELRQVIAVYEQVAGRKLPIVWGARPYRPREVMAPWHGRVLPGWRPRVGLREGILRTIRSYENAGVA